MIGIVTKPFDRHDLYQAIETSLSEQGSMASDHSAEQPFQETTVHPEFDEAMVVGLLGALDEESQLMLLNQCTIDLSEGLKAYKALLKIRTITRWVKQHIASKALVAPLGW